MAMNPMQKKARTSFLMGVLVTILILGIVIGILLYMMKNINDELTSYKANLKKVYVLSQDVTSGQELNMSMFTEKEVDINTIPGNAATFQQKIKNGEYDAETSFVAKYDIQKNTVITEDLVYKSDEVVTKDVREQDYNMVVLPVDLEDGQYVDIRLMVPNGEDFIVLSKKKVTIPQNSDGTYIADTIRLSLREDEILAMSSAIVEAYGITGAKIYATVYKEAGAQEAATPTYTPNSAVTTLIGIDSNGNITNPNIVEQAKTELQKRYLSPSTTARNNYLQSLINNDAAYDANVQTGMSESITSSEEARQNYIDSLGSGN